MSDEKKVQRILVVDDESHISFPASLALRMAGFMVTTACCGREGLEILRYKIGDGKALNVCSAE
jgi:DNA-binding response OmpR family regulator